MRIRGRVVRAVRRAMYSWGYMWVWMSTTMGAGMVAVGGGGVGGRGCWGGTGLGRGRNVGRIKTEVKRGWWLGGWFRYLCLLLMVRTGKASPMGRRQEVSRRTAWWLHPLPSPACHPFSSPRAYRGVGDLILWYTSGAASSPSSLPKRKRQPPPQTLPIARQYYRRPVFRQGII